MSYVCLRVWKVIPSWKESCSLWDPGSREVLLLIIQIAHTSIFGTGPGNKSTPADGVT